MRWLERFRMAMQMLFRCQSETARLNDELQFHLDQQFNENIAHGLSPEEARTAAMRAFGNPALIRDQSRSSWNWMEKLVRNLRYGVRTLTRSPGFALTAILVMALGIGATTSLFTKGEDHCTRDNSVVCGLTSPAQLARFLKNIVGRPVMDKTGIEGRYDVLVDFDTYAYMGGTPPAGYDKPSLESVLEEQLGLRLVAGKKSLPVYVVESVERPTGN